MCVVLDVKIVTARYFMVLFFFKISRMIIYLVQDGGIVSLCFIAQVNKTCNYDKN